MVIENTNIVYEPTAAAKDNLAALANEYVYHASFASPSACKELYHSQNRSEHREFTWSTDSAPTSASRNAPTQEEEKNLFLKYNYARWMLHKAQERKGAAGRKAQELWKNRVLAAREEIVQANMALVLAMVRRVRFPNVELDELVSEGSMALLRSIDKFDISRGFRFSTYSCRAILQSFTRLIQKEAQHKRRFPVQFEAELETVNQAYNPETPGPDNRELVRTILTRNLADLTPLEQSIVKQRFAIDSPPERRKMKTIASEQGYTTRKVRQIMRRAFRKIRLAMEVCTSAA